MLFSADNRPASQPTTPTFPGVYSSFLQGQQGGLSEMLAHGLSPGAAGMANMLGDLTNSTSPIIQKLMHAITQGMPQGAMSTMGAQGGNATNIQSLLQNIPSLNWQQLLNPMSILSMSQQQQSTTPQSIFSLNNQQAWQNTPGQA